MKLWDKGYTVNNLVDKFTVGNDRKLDLYLAKYDVQASLAHAKMLTSIGLLSEIEYVELEKSLDTLKVQIEEGKFIIEEQFEDVHSKIEYELVKQVGEAGKKIHTARSRNDQVLVALHLYAKAELKKIFKLVEELFDTLIDLSEKHKEVLIPGYTHMQVAMPSSFGLWFSAYAESLIDDLVFIQAAQKVSDQNPLGSAAGYGSSFPIDRSMTTKLMGFEYLKVNSVAAQMSRGKLEKSLAFALASLAGTLAKLSSDVCLYMSQNFGFLSFPKELTTGSSIMPHKQNPDVFELIRAKCNKTQNYPNEVMMLTNNLSSGYHRDFQMLKQGLIENIEVIKDCTTVCSFMLKNIIVKDGVLNQSIYNYLYSVEEVNKLVVKGISFREAYQKIGHSIQENDFTFDSELNHKHIAQGYFNRFR